MEMKKRGETPPGELITPQRCQGNWALETFSSDLGEDLYESKKVLEITIIIRYLFL